MSKKTPKPDFAQVALSVVQQATGSELKPEPRRIALASARKRKPGRRK